MSGKATLSVTNEVLKRNKIVTAIGRWSHGHEDPKTVTLPAPTPASASAAQERAGAIVMTGAPSESIEDSGLKKSYLGMQFERGETR